MSACVGSHMRRIGFPIVALAALVDSTRAADYPFPNIPPAPPAAGMPVVGGGVARGPELFHAPALRNVAGDIHSPGHLPMVPAREQHSRPELDAFLDAVSQRDAAVQVILGQGRLLTLEEELIQPEGADPYIAVGDPTVIDFDVVDPRHLRVTGKRIGVTDLSIITAGREDFNVEIHVVANLNLLRARLMQAFPDATIRLTPMQQHLIVSGQARDVQQIAQILKTIEAYLASMQVSKKTKSSGIAGPTPGAADPAYANKPDAASVDPATGDPNLPPPQVLGRTGGRQGGKVELPVARIINLMTVPGPRQVLLRVRVAELNRTAFRQLGVSFMLQNSSNAIGSQITLPLVRQRARRATQAAGAGAGTLLQLLNPAGAALFGIFDSKQAGFLIQALRNNQVLKILAEPNLVAYDGQPAHFLAGGQFPVPVPQPGAAGNTITIQYKSFGVSLDFVPYILDNEMIRLSVAPEVTALNFATGTTVAGVSVPGLKVRKTSTVVQLREGQTLAISGILQVEMSGSTRRIPGLGDLPYIGSLFRNTTNRKVEKELVILVTPFLIQPMPRGADPQLPGENVLAPDDLELYLLGRIERRRPSAYRATAAWDDPYGLEKKDHLRGYCMPQAGGMISQPPTVPPLAAPPQWEIERRYINGPVGYSP